MVNEQMRQTWTDCASGWIENESRYDRIYAPVTTAIVDAAHLGPDDRVLDIGCGTGTLLEQSVAAGVTSVVGVDISPTMTAAAVARVPDAQVIAADVQETDLTATSGAPFSKVVSRFGVMFFDDPVKAFTNIRRACTSDATLTFVCWRSLAENPTFTLGTPILTGRLATPPIPPASGMPGPIAFAEPSYVTAILTDAGWGDVVVDPLDFDCVYGTGAADDGVEERLAMLLATPGGLAAAAQLEPQLGADGWSDLLDEIRADVRGHIRDGHVRHAGACWLVTARVASPV